MIGGFTASVVIHGEGREDCPGMIEVLGAEIDSLGVANRWQSMVVGWVFGGDASIEL